MSRRRAPGPELPGFEAEGEAAHPEPDREERASPDLHPIFDLDEGEEAKQQANPRPSTSECSHHSGGVASTEKPAGLTSPPLPPSVCRVPTEAEAQDLARTEPEFVRPVRRKP